MARGRLRLSVRWGLVLLVALLVHAAVPARADDGAAVVIVPPEGLGPSWPLDALLAFLRLELGRPILVGGPDAPRAGALVIRLSAAEGPARAALERVDVAVDGRAAPAVDLTDLPPSQRPRALALTIAELLRDAERPASTAAAPRAAPRPASPAASAAPVPPPTPAPTPPPLRVSVSAAGGVRYYTAFARGFGSARLGVSLRFARLAGVALELDAGFSEASFRDALGEATLRVFPVAASAKRDVTLGPMRLGFGLRIEVAFASGEGLPSANARGERLSAQVVTATVAGELAWPIRPYLVPFLSPELGATVSGIHVRADDRIVGGLAGPVAFVHAGIAAGL